MGRSDDPFWKEVEDMNGGSMKCKFCGHLFANGTSISRIKWHLSGERGHGVEICCQVPKEVQGAAFLAMRGGNKRHKDIAMREGSFQHVDRSVDAHENRGEATQGTDLVDQFVDGTWVQIHSALSKEQQLNEISTYLMQEDEDVERLHDEFETVARTEQVQHLERGSSCERPSINQADEPRGDSSQPTDPLCLDHGRYYDQLCAPSLSKDVVMYDVQNMVRVRTEPVEEEGVENSRRSVQVGAGARSSESLKYNTSETRGVPLPTSSTKPVGQAFEENTKEIWSLLMDDKVPTIGIYGMGGIGKTTILKHIYNELLQRPNICDHVWWVIVSQDFSITRLQNLIAKCLHLDLANEDDDVHRAAKLSEELRTKQKWILILDDLWHNFELDEVGIPVLLKGCKLIMTTRSETVCHRMACHHKIKVKLLSEGEAWTLFMEKLGRDIALLPEVEGIAKDIAGECPGLPLGIIAVAGSLRGVDDPHEWRNTLNKLRESEFRDIDDKVFRLLRFSYDRLGDLALKQCLLYCALFPEDDIIAREELIGYLIDEGIIKGKRSRGDAFDESNTMLNRLEYVCLLESAQMGFNDIRRVKMHDLIRDMATQILQDESQVMVKAGAQLKELPDAEEWTQNLTKVSLMRNKIEEIPSSYSPKCPYLSTLFLRDNKGLRFIADSFFKQLHGLKVLDLSWTGIENLPDSVSDLVSLTALLLCMCDNLRFVPSLKKLRALKRLDLSCTRLEKMPQGMECLTNLRYLRMNGYGEKEFPSGILPKLSHLQVFVQEQFMPQDDAPITVKVKEVGSLRNLETLECHFEGFSDFVEYLRSRDGILSLSTCKILVGEVRRYLEQLMEDFPSKTVGLGNLSINGDRDFQVKFLNGIQGLICECIDARSLCDVLSLENATKLERISIRECHNMGFIFLVLLCSTTIAIM
ncbi:disease resistance protein At4g27190-like [Populus alba]|uniref:disease resistance protein At4g27190-like n=1 Tax=Populus alba TaxID=43335 RepID=UPI00158CD85E|nr:putative disease resistance protein At4g10780 [Populus alba]